VGVEGSVGTRLPETQPTASILGITITKSIENTYSGMTTKYAFFMQDASGKYLERLALRALSVWV
jgi:hypothetical protein